jgi:hypothetical protein
MSVLPAMFAANGFLLAPGPISARGPASVAQILGRDSLNATSRLRVLTVGGDVSRDGNDGFTYGYFDTFRASGDSVVGWYHAYWRREGGGDWKMLALVRRRRPPGEMTPPRPLAPVKDARCVEPPRGADTIALLKEIMAADLAFSDSAATSVAAAFGGFAADDAAKPGKESGFVFGKACDRAAVRSTSAEWSQVGTGARCGVAQRRFRFHRGQCKHARRRPESAAPRSGDGRPLLHNLASRCERPVAVGHRLKACHPSEARDDKRQATSLAFCV